MSILGPLICWCGPFVVFGLFYLAVATSWRWEHRPLTLRRAKRLINKRVEQAVSDMELAAKGTYIQRGGWWEQNPTGRRF
jgi:hypothetical protein